MKAGVGAVSSDKAEDIVKVIDLRSIQGPNVHHHLPVAVMRIDLEDWTEKANNEIPGFIEKLRQTLPGLYEHKCSVGSVGGEIVPQL